MSSSIRNELPAVDEDSEGENTPNKFNEMMEQQRIESLYRAQAKLSNLKTFRINNEQYYRNKELQEIRKKEIKQPLEEAITVIEVLEEKLARRDDMISKLRKYISVDLLKGQEQSFEDIRVKVVEINQADEINQQTLMDKVAELQKIMESQTIQISRQKETIMHQKEKNKKIVRDYEIQEIDHREQLRRIENERDAFQSIAGTKENKIQDLIKNKEQLESHITQYKEEIKGLVLQYQQSQSEVNTIKESLHTAQQEYEELQGRYSATQFSLLECKEHLTELKERHVNLRTRYETLVKELDEMVEAGCTIPTTEEVRLAGRGGARRQGSMKRAGKLPVKARGLSGGGSLCTAEGVEGEGSADSSTYTDTMDSPQRYSNPDGNRCQLRMLTEDEEADLAVAESAARRRGDVLGQEVTQLRQTIARLQLQHETELRAVKAGNEGMEAQFGSLNSEVTRLTTKNQELSSKNYHLSSDLQEQTQKTETLEEQCQELRQQLEEIQQQQIHYQEEYSNLQQQYTELQSRTHTPAVIPLHSTVVSNTIQADEPVSSETLDAYDFGIPPEYDDNFNINDYISAPPVDVSTQIGASEFLEQSTQYPYINDPDYFPCEQACQTNAQDYLYPTEHYLETLFRDFIEESQTHIPESHAHILCNSRGVEDSTKEPYSRLGANTTTTSTAPPLLEEAATFRVKKGLGYLSALNTLRNKHIHYINTVGSWNTINTRMVVRCLDLILQTTHNILCPPDMLEDSDYAELRKGVDPQDVNYYAAELQEDSQIYGQLKAITAKWKSSTQAIMKRDSTFKLTESELTSDPNYGIPKGFLNKQPGQPLSKAVVKYMNRSFKRRVTVEGVDQLLDEIAGESPGSSSAPASRIGTSSGQQDRASVSRSGTSSSQQDRAPTAPLDWSPSQRGAPPSRAASTRTGLSSRSNSVSPGRQEGFSPDVSPSWSASRKHRSNSLDSDVPISAPDAVAVTTEDHHTAMALQGYYNFGNDLRSQKITTTTEETSLTTAVEPSTPTTASTGRSLSVKFKLNNNLPIAASFEISEDSEFGESGQFTDRNYSRKHSTQSQKRSSIGSFKTGSFQDSDYVDYTRIPFDARSPENALYGKKFSVSSPSVQRKDSGSQGEQQQEQEGFMDDTCDGMQDCVGTSLTTTTTIIAVDGLETMGSSGVLRPNVTSKHPPVVFTSSPQASTATLHVPESAAATALRQTSSIVPFPRINSAAAAPPTLRTAGEERPVTPTLYDHAARLQQSTPLPPPQPEGYLAGSTSSTVETPHSNGDSLRNLLQRNIESSAMAVHQLQQAQTQRQQGSGLEIGGRPLAQVLSPPPRPRLSSASRQPSLRSSRHKPRDIDWTNATYTPALTTTATDPPPARLSPAPQEPCDRATSFEKTLSFSSATAPSDCGIDTAVVRRASPDTTAASRKASTSPTSTAATSIHVAGRKRNVEANREKVTNTVLYM